jgi:hypothetical protein
MLQSPMVASVHAHLGGETAVDEIGRQMHGDEGELEAAGEEAEHQEHVGAVRERLRKRLLQRLRRRMFGLLDRRGRQRQRERQHGEHARGEDEKRLLPADRIDQHDGQRRIEELPERAGRGTEPEGERAPFRRQELSERRENDDERGAGQAEADERAGRYVEQRRARRMRHQGEAGGEHQGAGTEHPHGAEAVGDDAGERLADAPQEILEGEPEGEDVPPPMIGLRHRRQEEAERGARPERYIIEIRQPKPTMRSGVRHVPATDGADRRARSVMVGFLYLGRGRREIARHPDRPSE